jgi:hypothetical protein
LTRTLQENWISLYVRQTHPAAAKHARRRSDL